MKEQYPNLQKLCDYINAQANPHIFAAVLLSIAAIMPRETHKEETKA